MATDTDPEGWPEVLDLLEARKRRIERFYEDLAGKPDTAAEVTAQYEADDAVYRQRLEALCDGREDLAALAQMWNAAHGYGVAQ